MVATLPPLSLHHHILHSLFSHPPATIHYQPFLFGAIITLLLVVIRPTPN
jgi:hypothetical protein